MLKVLFFFPPISDSKRFYCWWVCSCVCMCVRENLKASEEDSLVGRSSCSISTVGVDGGMSQTRTLEMAHYLSTRFFRWLGEK